MPEKLKNTGLFSLLCSHRHIPPLWGKNKSQNVPFKTYFRRIEELLLTSMAFKSHPGIFYGLPKTTYEVWKQFAKLGTNSELCQDAWPTELPWEMSLRDTGQGKNCMQCTFLLGMRNIEWQLHGEGEEAHPGLQMLLLTSPGDSA